MRKIFLTVLFSMLLLNIALALEVDKKEFVLGETIEIIVDDLNADLTILSLASNEVYKYLGVGTDKIKFNPKEAGEYLINSVGTKTETLRFKVIKNDAVESKNNTNKIFLSKVNFKVGETVLISLSQAEDLFIEISTPKNNYLFLGDLTSEIRFNPKEIGEFHINLKDSSGNILETEKFTVQYEERIQISKAEKIHIRDSKGIYFNSRIRISKDGINLKDITTNDQLDLAIGKYDIEFLPDKSKIKSLKFYNLSYAGDLTLNYEELPNSMIKENHRIINSIFAIDPTNIKFDYGEITFIADGFELYKCKDYNFTKQECYGSYEKILDMIPGQEYKILLTPEDPQYVQKTTKTQGCSCTNSCNTGSGASSQCTASCTDYCDVNFTNPPIAITGFIQFFIPEVMVMDIRDHQSVTSM